MQNVASTFATFRQQTADDVSAAILTLASVLVREPADETPLTVKQAAALLKVSPDTIYEMVEAKKLPCRRIGRAIRIQPSDLTAVGKPRVFKLRELA